MGTPPLYTLMKISTTLRDIQSGKKTTTVKIIFVFMFFLSFILTSVACNSVDPANGVTYTTGHNFVQVDVDPKSVQDGQVFKVFFNFVLVEYVISVLFFLSTHYMHAHTKYNRIQNRKQLY